MSSYRVSCLNSKTRRSRQRIGEAGYKRLQCTSCTRQISAEPKRLVARSQKGWRSTEFSKWTFFFRLQPTLEMPRVVSKAVLMVWQEMHGPRQSARERKWQTNRQRIGCSAYLFHWDHFSVLGSFQGDQAYIFLQ